MDMHTLTLWFGIGLFFFLLTALAIIDIATKDFGSLPKKAIWGIVAMVPFIGCLVYLAFGFRQGKRKHWAPDSENNI